MIASAVRLSGVTSRESGARVLTRPAIGADGRVISVGISAALFCQAGIRRGAKLSLPGDQMAIAAQHAYRFAASGPVKCFEDANKNVPAFSAWLGGGFDRMTHR